MVSYATVTYFVSLFAIMFVYTLTWDLYTGFWTMAVDAGGDATIMGYFYTIHQWIPAAFFLSLTFWYLVQAQRRTA
ncbi:MAG: hypothetical protein WC343_02275 [Bacilli bacterium]